LVMNLNTFFLKKKEKNNNVSKKLFYLVKYLFKIS
jgi:hypothetical protein